MKAPLVFCALVLLLLSGCVVEVNDTAGKPAQEQSPQLKADTEKPLDTAPKRPWQPRKTPPPALPPEPEPTTEPTPEPVQPGEEPLPTPEPSPEPVAPPTDETPVQGKPLAKEITVTLAAYRYYPDKIMVAKGDLVRLKITSNSDGLGNGIGFKIEGQAVDVVLKKGQTKSVEFTPDRTGTYVIYCGPPCGPTRSGLKLGELVVAGD